MKKLILKPDSWLCSLEDCPPGLFWYEEQVCFKSEYHHIDNIRIQAFNSAGEYMAVGNDIKVIPLVYEWQEE